MGHRLRAGRLFDRFTEAADGSGRFEAGPGGRELPAVDMRIDIGERIG